MNEIYQTAVYRSPVGQLTAARMGESLCGLWIAGQKHFLRTIDGACRESGRAQDFADIFGWLDEYFAGKNPPPGRLKLAPGGSDFSRAVWDRLLAIPYGGRASYGQIAREIEAQTGKKCSPRAVGGAVGRNPISIVIPCHRVVGAGGALTGYAGGLPIKRALLELEGCILD